MMILKIFKKSKLKTIVYDNKKFKKSDVWRKLMEINNTLKRKFANEAIDCKYFSSDGCKHKNHKNRTCNIDKCPL